MENARLRQQLKDDLLRILHDCQKTWPKPKKGEIEFKDLEIEVMYDANPANN